MKTGREADICGTEVEEIPGKESCELLVEVFGVKSKEEGRREWQRYGLVSVAHISVTLEQAQ